MYGVCVCVCACVSAEGGAASTGVQLRIFATDDPTCKLWK